MLGAILLQITLIFLNAIFASAEIAVLSVGDAKLEKLAEKGDRRAKNLLFLTQNPSRFLSTIQVAITLAGLLGSAYAAENFADPAVNLLLALGVPIARETLKSICVLLITLLLSFFSIVLGELVPKRLAMKNAEKISLTLAGLLRTVSFLFAPFVWILTKSTNGILRLFRIDPNEQDEQVTEEDIRMMLETGSEHGSIDSRENEMIKNVFEFNDMAVSEVCTHRRDVDFLYQKDSFERWKAIIAETRHSCYPVVGDDADDILGVLNVKKLFRFDCTDTETAFRCAVEKPYFVPQSMKTDVLFSNMQQRRCYFAVVVDEYGGTGGIITMHDLLELLVGDMDDEQDPATEDMKQLTEDTWRIEGGVLLDEVAETLELDLSEYDCDTFGGYVMDQLGYIPADGETPAIETPEFFVTVEKVEDRRVVAAVVRKKAAQDTEEE